MSGEQINRMKDRRGELMTDSYLVKMLAVEHPVGNRGVQEDLKLCALLRYAYLEHTLRIGGGRE